MEQEQAKIGELMYSGKAECGGDCFLILKKIKKEKGIVKSVFDYYEFCGTNKVYIVKNWTIEPHELSWSDEKVATSKQKRFFLKKIAFGNLEKEID
jgi:hypothetical protein